MVLWKELAGYSDEQLEPIDVALMHEACCEGLPGAEDLDIPADQRFLDELADLVETETERLFPVFHREPEHFHNSSAYFRMLVLASVLQRDVGFPLSDKTFEERVNFSAPRESYLHAFLRGAPGSCGPITLLHVAVGRRLGYPLRFVFRPRHFFACWEGPDGQGFYIECTSRGILTPPGDLYLAWPVPFPTCGWMEPGPRGHILYTPAETYWLSPLRPREVLSIFLNQRAICFSSCKRYREALEALSWSHEAAPHHRPNTTLLWFYAMEWEKELRSVLPPGAAGHRYDARAAVSVNPP